MTVDVGSRLDQLAAKCEQHGWGFSVAQRPNKDDQGVWFISIGPAEDLYGAWAWVPWGITQTWGVTREHALQEALQAINRYELKAAVT